MRRLVCVLLLAAAACGEDETNPPPPPGTAAAAGSNAKKDDKSAKLQARAHVEDNVRCPLPNDGKPDADAKECKPDSPTCKEGTYCLQFSDKWFCEPCGERDAIRKEFRERDFATEQSRDPFVSTVLIPAGVGPGSAAEPVAEPHKNCTRKDQFAAPTYSYADLRLVGIVAQGTARKALMMDTGNPNLGWIIKRGDCVGKEKAVVKEIGTGDITFVVDADPQAKRQAEQRTVPLHPMSPTMMQNDEDATAPETQPTVPPPAMPKSEKPALPDKR